MATITHAGFRTLVSEFGGCDLYFTEMISAEALSGGTAFEEFYLELDPEPARTIYQVVGYSVRAVVAAGRRLAERPCAGIDINMGCSAPHIVRKGGGVAWMKKPEEAAVVVSELRSMLPDKTLSAKLRLGSDDDPERLADFAGLLEDAGVDFLSLHPKTRRDGAHRPARWSFVDKLQSSVGIPVIGNGGIVDRHSYRERAYPAGRKRSAVMIGRGAVRRPWIFSHLRAHEHPGEEPHGPGIVDLVRLMERFFSLLERHQPPEFWPTRARRIYPYILKNLPFGHSVGARLAQEGDYHKGKREILDYLKTDPARRKVKA